MQKILHAIETQMNNFKVKQKLQILYVCCVLIPLILTDSIILSVLIRGERTEQIYNMKNIASAVQYDLLYTIGENVSNKNKIYINRRINDFMDKEYGTELDFIMARYDLVVNSLFNIGFNSDSSRIIFYADNEGIVNGGYFFRLSTVKGEDWYQDFSESGLDEVLYCYFSGDRNLSPIPERTVSFIKRLNYFRDSGYEKLVKYDIDYNNLVRKIMNMQYNLPVYVCNGNRILFSNTGDSKYTEPFASLTGEEDIGYEKQITLYGQVLRIIVLKPQATIMTRIGENLPLILFLIAINILLPWMLMQIINRSFTGRLRELSRVFDTVEETSLTLISPVRGKDEIGGLMSNYNRMVEKFHEMIRIIYKDRLEKQEMDIARKNAELLALQSQINPHFLFNVLESIRMHSLIRGEQETAAMIEKLALLERQNVKWSDYVKTREEISIIEAYLELQKYRFEDRLKFPITKTSFRSNRRGEPVSYAKRAWICW